MPKRYIYIQIHDLISKYWKFIILCSLPAKMRAQLGLLQGLSSTEWGKISNWIWSNLQICSLNQARKNSAWSQGYSLSWFCAINIFSKKSIFDLNLQEAGWHAGIIKSVKYQVFNFCFLQVQSFCWKIITKNISVRKTSIIGHK